MWDTNISQANMGLEKNSDSAVVSMESLGQYLNDFSEHQTYGLVSYAYAHARNP